MKTETPTRENILQRVFADSPLLNSPDARQRTRIYMAMEEYASIKTKALEEELKEVKEYFQMFKKGIAKGTELYANLRFDDAEFTPYQLALQANKELLEALQECTSTLKRTLKSAYCQVDDDGTVEEMEAMIEKHTPPVGVETKE